MGCNCYKPKSAHEKLIDEVFLNFILRKKSLREIEDALTPKSSSKVMEMKDNFQRTNIEKEFKNSNDETHIKHNYTQVREEKENEKEKENDPLPSSKSLELKARKSGEKCKPKYLAVLRKASKKNKEEESSQKEKKSVVILEEETTCENKDRMKSIFRSLKRGNDLRDNISYITETAFQEFFNSFLILHPSCSYSDCPNPIFHFWFDFYRSKPYKTQVPLIKFTLVLLCEAADCIDKDIYNLITIMRQYDSITHPAKMNKEESLNNLSWTMGKQLESPQELVKLDSSKIDQIKERDKAFELTYDQMFDLLKDYIYSISLMAVEHLQNLSCHREEFYACLSSAWNSGIIDEFIIKKILGESSEHNEQIKVKSFLKKNIGLLRDDARLRQELTDFSVRYRDENQEKFLMKQYTDFHNTLKY